MRVCLRHLCNSWNQLLFSWHVGDPAITLLFFSFFLAYLSFSFFSRISKINLQCHNFSSTERSCHVPGIVNLEMMKVYRVRRIGSQLALNLG